MKILFFSIGLLLYAHTAWAQSELARDIPVGSNPRFLPLFLDRFSDGFRAKTRFEPEMPESLRRFWRDNMSEPRDFAEEIRPGIKWPRFQWGIETGPGSATTLLRPVYQWFDVKNPERLVREWNRAFCFDAEKNYIGVSWSGDQSVMEFFINKGGQLTVRRYLNKKFAKEYVLELKIENGQSVATAIADGRILFTQIPVGRTSPRLSHPQAAHLQFAIQREFLLSPRTFAKGSDGMERVFFP